jgi:proteasome lid subunit RPN8/RPN11
VVARIERYVPYDDLDPNCLDSGIVHFDGRHYGKLWELCRREELAVVADVHTHPGGVQQSGSDQAHPMVAQAGHLALILPRFAMGRFGRDGIGMYRYLGARRWETVPPAARRDFFHIGL